MKYIDEYRDGVAARRIAAVIAEEAKKRHTYRLMEFCGGHTHAISRYGIEDLLPGNIRMIHGPGCPVCVLPMGQVDVAIDLALRPDVILCIYSDLLRVPGSNGRSLLKARAEGADVRMVYSAADSLTIARENPGREIVFFAIGFETTTPPTAVALKTASAKGIENYSIYCNHVLTPAAMNAILASEEERPLLDGFIGPAHVSTVIGSKPYEPFAETWKRPVVIAGFEPLDVLQAILMLVRQLNDGRAEVENEFSRAVTRYGNLKAQEFVAETMEPRPFFEWRGLGIVPDSALKIRDSFSNWDAERRFGLLPKSVAEDTGCECGAILRGVKRPSQCRLFGRACTPENPVGSCMVSSEGACAAHWTYGRFRKAG
ncbi:hydrogenase expression/formation protein hypD2 [Alphaproteobacteria bacterium]|nr:hydrogenase expression/formation protein hypD2 [Alphaproteobacteria bacterium]